MGKNNLNDMCDLCKIAKAKYNFSIKTEGFDVCTNCLKNLLECNAPNKKIKIKEISSRNH